MKLKNLKTEFLGRNVMFYQSIDSTQKQVKSFKQPINGTLIIADNQVAAVGTHDRKWYTGNGKNIAMSFVLIPKCPIKKIQDITIDIAKCMVSTINKMYTIKLDIKKPNDLYCNHKKVGGILTETLCKGENVNRIYIGIGMNINQEEFPGNLSEIATSLKKEFGKEFCREDIIVEFLNEFENVYIDMIK